MRTHRNYATAAVLTLAATLWATSAFAQSQPLRADIPFDFYVAGKLLPAGAYIIAPTAQGNAVRVSDQNGNSAFVMTRSYKANHATTLNRLAFHRYGTSSFLTAVYWIGFPNGRELATSEMERQLAKSGSTPTPVAILVK